MVRPPLPPLETRSDRFDLTIGSTAEFLRGAWPELREVRFEVSGLPLGTVATWMLRGRKMLAEAAGRKPI